MHPVSSFEVFILFEKERLYIYAERLARRELLYILDPQGNPALDEEEKMLWEAEQDILQKINTCRSHPRWETISEALSRHIMVLTIGYLRNYGVEKKDIIERVRRLWVNDIERILLGNRREKPNFGPLKKKDARPKILPPMRGGKTTQAYAV